MSEQPPEPMTQLAEGAAQLHELLTAYVTAGFTRSEAMEIVIAIITAQIGTS